MLKIYLLILLLLHFLILYFTRFTAWPEMFSYPYLINNGFKPYLDIAFPYEPLLPLILGGIYKIFGTNLQILQIITWSVILSSDLLIFLISIKIIGKKIISLLPLVLYIFIQPVVDGNMLWFDLATVPFILLSVVFYLYCNSPKKFILLGLFLGTAFFIKQQVGITMAMLGIYFLITRSFKDFIYYFLGFLVPATIIGLYIFANNLLNDYIFWTIIVPLKWYPSFPGYVHIPTIKEVVLAILVFGSIIAASFHNLKIKNSQFIMTMILFFGAFLTAFPRFELFRVQPAVAISIALLCFIIPGFSKKVLLIISLPVVFAGALLWMKIIPDIGASPRFYSRADLDLADNIKTRNKQNKLYLLGISSLQYVFTDKVPLKPWVDNYIWYMEIPGIQEKVLDGLKQDKPEIIFRRSPGLGNWFDLGVYQPKKIVDYINMNYNKTEIIDRGIEVWIKKD